MYICILHTRYIQSSNDRTHKLIEKGSYKDPSQEKGAAAEGRRPIFLYIINVLSFSII